MNLLIPRLLEFCSDWLELLRQRRHRVALGVFAALCLNLAIAPAVLASTNGSIERSTAYAIGILSLVPLGLAIYLFAVIFQPERF
ncbi:MAG: K(+)-transporting ATPase subunit F [Elainellaceae cyanobacterium]